MSKNTVSKGLRIFILLIVMAISGYVMLQRSDKPAGKTPSPCSNCSKVSSCDLPDAKDFKGEK